MCLGVRVKHHNLLCESGNDLLIRFALKVRHEVAIVLVGDNFTGLQSQQNMIRFQIQTSPTFSAWTKIKFSYSSEGHLQLPFLSSTAQWPEGYHGSL